MIKCVSEESRGDPVLDDFTPLLSSAARQMRRTLTRRSRSRENGISFKRTQTSLSDLSWSLRLDEILVDLLGLGSHFHRVLGLLEVLAGHPELHVLVAELRLQEAAEGIQTICR